jgi:hypothetical protein
VALHQHVGRKNSPLKWRAENQLKKALSSGHGKCMKSVAAAALGYALIGRSSGVPGDQQPSAPAVRAAGIASSIRQMAAMLPTIVRRCSP